METLSFEQIKELREHQTIKYGGWKFLSIMTSIAVEVGVMILIAYLGWQERGSDFSSLFWTLLFFILAVPVWFSIHDRRRRLHAYWSRNIRGYAARFYRTRRDDKQRWLDYTLRKSREARQVSQRLNEEPLAIDLPLNGGWGAILACDDFWRQRIVGWSVRLREISTGDTIVVELRHRLQTYGVDERIVTDIKSALEWLEEIAKTDSFGPSVSSFILWKARQLDDARREQKIIEDVAAEVILPDGQRPNRPFIVWLMDAVQLLITERDAARGAIQAANDQLRTLGESLTETRRELESMAHAFETASRERVDEHRRYNEAVGFISDVNDQFKASARLHDKIQALRIHEAVILWLSTLHGQTGAQHDTDVIALAEIRRRIQKQERRDRTRHDRTKPATPPATETP